MKILGVKSTITDVKHSQYSLNSRLETEKGRISNLVNRPVEIKQSEQEG